MESQDKAFKTITAALQNDGIAVVRTDTIYGIIARVDSEAAVEKVYRAKHRNPLKQCIVLIPDASAAGEYAQHIAEYSRPEVKPTSVVVPATNEPAWVLRGGTTIAYRVVRDAFLKRVVEAVGPVIAPSANPESQEPARTIEEAQRYFGKLVDAYIDGGEVPSDVQASRIVEVHADGTITTIRE